MANDCLVKKLKASVNNFALPLLNECRIRVYEGNGVNHGVKIQCNAGTKIFTDGTHVFYKGSRTTPLTEYTFNERENWTLLFEENADYDIVFMDRSKVLVLQPVDNTVTSYWELMNVGGVSYWNNLYALTLDRTYSKGTIKNGINPQLGNLSVLRTNVAVDLDSIGNTVFTQLTRLDLQYSKSYGSILSLVPFLGRDVCNNIVVEGCSDITGSITSFAEALVTAGRTAQLFIYVRYSGITGVPIEANRVTISFDSSYEGGYSITY